MSPFIKPIVLELCRISWNVLKISCRYRYACISSAVENLTLMRTGPNNADSHQELASNLGSEMRFVPRDSRP